MSLASGKARGARHAVSPPGDASSADWAQQLQVVEQRMARRRREIRRAWGALEHQSERRLRWLKVGWMPGLAGLVGSTLVALLWWRHHRRWEISFPRGPRRSRADVPDASRAGFGTALWAAAWPLLRQVLQPALQRFTEAQLAAWLERWAAPPARAGEPANRPGDEPAARRSPPPAEP